MPFSQVAPGVYFNEIDFSTLARNLGLARLCVVGGATKGPLNTPTTVNSETELVSLFGPPVTNDLGIISAIQFLRKGDQLTYIRVADDDETYGVKTADAYVPGLIGYVAAAKATGVLALLGNVADADNLSISDGVRTRTFEFDSNDSYTHANIEFDGQPSNGNTITINDGVNPPKIFEFDSDSSVADGHIAVVIGGDVAATNANFVAAVNGITTALRVTATPVNPYNVTITHDDGDENKLTLTRTGSDIILTPAHIPVLIGANKPATINNLIAAINASALSIDAIIDTGSTDAVALLTNSVAGTAGNVSITFNSEAFDGGGMSGGVDAVAPTATGVAFRVRAITPGTWGNSIEVKIQPTTVSNAPEGNFDLLVFAPNDPTRRTNRILVERFNNLSLNVADTQHYAELIVEGSKILGLNPSLYITLEDVTNGAIPTAASYVLGTSGGQVGADGIDGLVDADYVGTDSGMVPTGLKAAKNTDTLYFNLLAVPVLNTTQTLIDGIIDVLSYRGDALGLIDVPFGLTETQAIQWHNGVVPGITGAPNTQINNSYLTVNWSWCEVFDPYNKTNVWVPPCGPVAANAAYNDKVAGPQFPVAGHNRGVLAVLDVEVSPTREGQARLQRDGNVINPIVKFADSGATLFGNNTTYRRMASVLSQVHVRRMLLHVQKLIANATKYLLFEPGDPVTWSKFELLVNPILDGMKGNQGLEDFRVICNAQTNPPEKRIEKRMNAKILLKPYNAVETLEIDMALFATGAEFDENLLK